MILSPDDVAQRLIGLPVLAVTSDPGSGSLFHLGKWIPRERPIRNPNISEQLQSFEGSESIFVMCPWELESPIELVDRDSPPSGGIGRMRLLEAMIGSSIEAARFEAAPLTLLLDFDNSMRLRLWPVQEGEERQTLSIGIRGMDVVLLSSGVIQQFEQ